MRPPAHLLMLQHHMLFINGDIPAKLQISIAGVGQACVQSRKYSDPCEDRCWFVPGLFIAETRAEIHNKYFLCHIIACAKESLC